MLPINQTQYYTTTTTAAADLIAIDLTGAGPLAAPGEAVRSELSATLDMVSAVEPGVLTALQKTPIDSEAEAIARQHVEGLRSDPTAALDSPVDVANQVFLYASKVKARSIRRVVFQTAGHYRSRATTAGLAVLEALDVFDEAIAAFVGPPDQLAVAVAAREVFAGIITKLGIEVGPEDISLAGERVCSDWICRLFSQLAY